MLLPVRTMRTQGNQQESPRGSPGARPGVLLTMGAYNGTLAALRSLACAGVEVVVADGQRWAPARWSRLVTRCLVCPSVEREPDAFLAFLLRLGAREPGRVLYPSSDDTAWLVSRHRAALERFYRVPAPAFEVTYSLLNKWRLYQACRQVGLAAPLTWLPRSEAEVEALAREAPFPLLLKPQTQAMLQPHQKGRVAERPSALLAQWRDLIARTRHPRAVVAADSQVGLPLVQQLHTHHTDLYSLSGFRSPDGAHFVVEASRKLLQWPPRLGVGLCFEEDSVIPALAEGLGRLCRHLGYFGAFEAEFVEVDGRHLLIDFNPRFYGQMGFDVARGLDLPLLVYLLALDEREALARQMEVARGAAAHEGGRGWCNRVELELSLPLLLLAGRIDLPEARRWHGWLRWHKGRLADAVLDTEDVMPGAVDLLTAIGGRLRHARSTWRLARTG